MRDPIQHFVPEFAVNWTEEITFVFFPFVWYLLVDLDVCYGTYVLYISLLVLSWNMFRIISGIEQVFLNVGVGLINLSKDSLATSLRVYDSENMPQTPTSGFPVMYGSVEDSGQDVGHSEKSLCCFV